MTGEIGIHGNVKPIGGVYPKAVAARKAGAKTVIIPEENLQSILGEINGITVIPVKHLNEVFEHALIQIHRQEDSIPASIELSKKESI
jgi:Lon-like ATP-dependent protease